MNMMGDAKKLFVVSYSYRFKLVRKEGSNPFLACIKTASKTVLKVTHKFRNAIISIFS